MAIDDPFAALEQQYPSEKKSPLELVLFSAKITFPKAGIPLEIFSKVLNRFTKVSVDERLTTTYHMLVGEIKNLEKTKADLDDMATTAQLIMRHDAEEFNDRKRERFVKMFGNALRSEEQIQDVTSFVQTLEQLNERDLTVLRVLNKIMNKEGDWKSQHNPSANRNIMKLNPSTLIGRSQELAVQVAMALGQAIETDVFTREEGYGVCNRLQGFGLAHELNAQQRELPMTSYCFRLSTSGLRLLRLLGEDVPNYDHYLAK